MNAVLEQIKRAVERTVEGAVVHVESVPVVETFGGQIGWEGVVEVFELCDPSQDDPDKAYGWAVESDQGPQYVAVKGAPPVDSPLAAVRVWVVS